MQPFLKWAGGKRWLTRTNQLQLPAKYGRYIEPFLGSGALFFHLCPQQSILSDLNSELINLYTMVKLKPKELLKIMKTHEARHSVDYYYKIRTYRPRTPTNRAARMLYLNRTCWNGLYRVNRSGEFNVPIGSKDWVLYPDENFDIHSSALCGATIFCSDFEQIIDQSSCGDLIFADPPYTVNHNSNGFLKYNEELFSWADQLRLHSALRRAVSRGAMVIATNADHESLRNLYREPFNFRRVFRSNVLSGKALFRGTTCEALFTANIDL